MNNWPMIRLVWHLYPKLAFQILIDSLWDAHLRLFFPRYWRRKWILSLRRDSWQLRKKLRRASRAHQQHDGQP